MYYADKNIIKTIPANTIVSNDIIAILLGLHIKHFPILFIHNHDEYYIIENTPKSINTIFKTSIILYEIDVTKDKPSKKDYYYFSEYEYTLNTEVIPIRRAKILNVYKYLQKKVIFIPYKTYIKFIYSYIPNSINKNNDKLDLYFHGSSVNISDKYLKPSHDGFEENKYVYVNKIRSASLLFCVRRFGTGIIWNAYNGYIWILETQANYMKIFDQGGYLYTIRDTGELVEEKFPSFISPKEIPIYKKEFIPNVYDKLLISKDIVIINYIKFKKFLGEARRNLI